jgi:hypothetical protein
MNVLNINNSSDSNDKYLYLEDKVFKKIIKNMAPVVIGTENGPLLESFGDILGNLSPISINITDAFYKSKNEWDPVLNNPPTNSIKNVQDTFNKTYINNFWKLKNKYSKNYLINHKLEEMLHQYSNIGDIDLNMDFQFFKNYDQLFTQDKHIANREYKTRKGSKPSMEYAYKNVWAAKVEGIFQESYYFDFSDLLIDELVWIGSCINPEDPAFVPDPNYDPFPPYYNNPYPYPPQEPFCDDPGTCNCTEPGKVIGKFIIADFIGGQEEVKQKFKYDVEGSLLPIFFNTMVKDLAHPVGFSFDYTRVFSDEWEDSFNLEIPVYADNVIIRSLCYEGDCSEPTNEYYSSTTGIKNITNSVLTKINYYEKTENFEQYNVSKFIFENGSFILQKMKIDSVDIVVEYYNNDFTNYINYLQNPDFNDYTNWSLGDRWYIDVAAGEAVLTSNTGDGVMFQSFSLENDKEYVIEINVTEINGSIDIYFGSDFIMNIKSPGKYFKRYYNYIPSVQDIIIKDELTTSTTRIDFIKLYHDIPTKKYPVEWHAGVQLEGFKYLRPLSLTTDETIFMIDSGDPTPFDPTDPDNGDYLNDMPVFKNKYPIIGEEIMIGDGTSNGDLLFFEIGCYDGSTGIYYPPYNSPDGCCIANDPHNPPGTPPGTCIIGEVFANDINLKYMYDEFEATEKNNKLKINVVDKGFDSNWNIVSGNATIIDGVLSQDGTQQSSVERELDICPIDGDFLTIKYLVDRIISVEKDIRIEYVNYDDTVLFSTKVDNTKSVPEWGWLINGSSCDNINKVKIRLILPVDYQIPMKEIEINKI